MNEEALQKYSDSVAETSRRKQTARARAFLQWLGRKEPSKRNVIAYRNELQKRYSDGAIKQDMMIIQKLFRMNGWPWPFNRGELMVVRENEVEQPALGPEWVEDMIDVVLGLKQPKGDKRPNTKHLTFLCASTIWGLRPGEMSAIRGSWLDVKSKTLFIQTAKGGRQRYHLIPDFVIPYLTAWGFKEPVGYNHVKDLFKDLEEMVGFTGPIARGVGWHAIRRSAISLAWDAGFNESQVHNFYRWKTTAGSMAIRYAGGRMIGKETELIKLPIKDLELDLEMHERHPFILMWREKSNAKRNT